MLDVVKLPDNAELKKPNRKDIDYISKNLRLADAKELLALETSLSFYTLLKQAVAVSTEKYVLRVDNIPVSLFGIYNNTAEKIGVIWCVATHTHRLMIKHAPTVLRYWKLKYRTMLMNEIFIENRLHIKWLEKLGFDFLEHKHRKNFKVFYKNV